MSDANYISGGKFTLKLHEYSSRKLFFRGSLCNVKLVVFLLSKWCKRKTRGLCIYGITLLSICQSFKWIRLFGLLINSAIWNLEQKNHSATVLVAAHFYFDSIQRIWFYSIQNGGFFGAYLAVSISNWPLAQRDSSKSSK